MKDIIVLDQFSFAAHAFHSVGLAMTDMRDQQQIMSDRVKGIEPEGVLLMTLFLVNPSGPVQQVTLDKGVAPTNRGGLQRIPFLAATRGGTIDIYISLISQLIGSKWVPARSDTLRKSLLREFMPQPKKQGPATEALKAELKGPTGVVKQPEPTGEPVKEEFTTQEEPKDEDPKDSS